MKKDDQIAGSIPFVMAGVKNNGVVNYISNPVAIFPSNSITVDIFGNTFYRNYSFGAGDDTGVYWNDENSYSQETMKFFAISMSKSLNGKFDFGKKLRSSQSLNFKMMLPVNSEGVDFDFMDAFIAELEAYLTSAGLKDYNLTIEEQQALDNYNDLIFNEFNVVDIFDVKNTGNILSRDIKQNSGSTPYLCASSENNGVSSYISYDKRYLENGGCIFIGGKTFVVSYQENDFYSNDSHNLILSLKGKNGKTKSTQLYLATCVHKSLNHKYSWGDSISNKKIQKDTISLPSKSNHPEFSSMEILISAIQKLVIKDVAQYADQKIATHKKVVKSGAEMI